MDDDTIANEKGKVILKVCHPIPEPTGPATKKARTE